MNLMLDERALTDAPGQRGIVLTTHRVRMRMTRAGADDVISIMLESIASCGLTRRSRPELLGLAAVCLLGGAVIGDTGLVAGVLLGLLCLGGYVASRQQVLVISSTGGEVIKVQTRAVGTDAVIAFIDAVEAAKNMRYMRQIA